MFINEQVAFYLELSYEFMNAEDEATDIAIYGDCPIRDLYKMFISA